MRKTRYVFCLDGTEQEVSMVLKCLQFKGLVANPYGTTIGPKQLQTIFEQNKSLVCAQKDFTVTPAPAKTFQIHITSTHTQNAIPAICLDGTTPIESQFASIASSFNCDIGDHKSNSSGLNGTPTPKDCAYCRYLQGRKSKNERTVYQSSNFFVIPTIGQFKTLYLLIIPFKHDTSFAELTPSSPLLEEFQTVVEDLEYILQLVNPNNSSILVWENGSGKGGKGKAKDSVVHAHVHVAPSDLTSEDIEDLSGFSFTQINLSDLPKYKDESYLLVRTPDPNTWLINNDTSLYIPRQLVRQYLAEEIGISDDSWNWRTHPFREKMHETVVDIFWALAYNWNNLPNRIKMRTVEFLKGFPV